MRDPATPDRRVERARAIALGLLACLILLSVAAVFGDARRPAGALLLGLFLVVPALLPLKGLWRRQRRVYAWATLCLSPHLVFGLTEVVANPALRGLAAWMLITCLGLAVTLVAYLRLTRASDRVPAPGDS